MKFVWIGKNNILQICLCSIFLLYIGGCGDEESQKTGDGFYTYSGYRDWYRVPLKFPYQLIMIDGLEQASIEKYDSSQSIADPNKSSTWLVCNVSQIAVSENFIAFRRDAKVEDGEAWGILLYESEKIQYFKNAKKLTAFIKQHYPDVKTSQWETTKEYYNRIWKMLNSQNR